MKERDKMRGGSKGKDNPVEEKKRAWKRKMTLVPLPLRRVTER